MNKTCVTGKKMYATQLLAEDVLIDLWSKHDYVENHAPVTVYKCEDCGYYHLTSQGAMNERLSSYITSGKIKRDREANRWLDKFKHK